MELGNGWEQTASVRDHLLMLEQIFGDHGSGTYVSLGDLFTGLDREQEDRLRRHLRYYGDEGWINLAETMDVESIGCYLEPIGISFVQSVRARRDNPPGRNRAARDAVLTWLYDQPDDNGEMPSIRGFLTDPRSHYYSSLFSSPEIDQATEFLNDKGLIDSVRGFGGAIARLRIRAEGRLLVESGRSVNEPPPGANAGTSINITGQGNAVQAHSPGASQQVTTVLTQNLQQTAFNLADRLEAVLPELGLDSDEARALPEDIREATKVDSPRLLRRVLQAAATVLATKAAEAVATTLIQELVGLINQLPL